MADYASTDTTPHRHHQGELTMKHDDHRNATAWWGSCESCDTAVIVYPHADAEADLPDMDEWENGGIFSRCYVCDEHVEWGDSDRVKDVLR